MQGGGNPRPQGRQAGHELHLKDRAPMGPHPNFRTATQEVHVGSVDTKAPLMAAPLDLRMWGPDIRPGLGLELRGFVLQPAS